MSSHREHREHRDLRDHREHRDHRDTHYTRPRAPSYTGLPPSHHDTLKHQPHPHPHPATYSTTSSTPSPYATSPATSYTNRAPSISTSSISSSSYAGSAEGDEGEEEGDMLELLTERLGQAFNPLVLDRGLVVQAQTSGMLNHKTRELIALQEEAQARLAETKRSFVEGMKIAKEVKADLDYVHRKVRALKQKTERKYPVEYNMARDRIPPPS
ncbi:hypothetical protein FPQ18DRAFT_118627 [Pyronema domesticum]|uniref:Biogenesis of lysosome-related organelles complex 1 subunit KXD1 n=1 Tax=Pyronema omphalodes (strain CBS 100304) TaxID=1076935 RepID=U4LJ18_PYROM|nr:hypothetical protein FPQ18DRAFT_118627 [Pyronema domesticum]CCX31943.1 Similar to Biogenesis of lysosome-related organelles complex 1 subunit KXD1; acc. no. Q755A2 [Pyronema omphalodes CBS 100304]